MTKWKCPRCKTWIVEEIARVCEGCQRAEIKP